MGKCGPCRHCGVTSTPLWRNGPPDKPVLCNACGSRWRTKGSLANYTPLHAREIDLEEQKFSKVKNIPAKPKEHKFQKKKQINSAFESEHELHYCDQNFQKAIKGDASNRSSAGSAVSYSESCAYFGTTESDITGSAQSNVWDSLVPSRKRTFLTRPKPSAVEKLTKDLYSIWHEQQSSTISGYSEDDLLYESGTPLGSSEIGYGGLLIRNPNSKSVEEESEASSFPVDKSSYTIGEAYSGSSSFPVNSEKKGTTFTNNGIDKLKKSAAELAQEDTKRDTSMDEILRTLHNRDSLLTSAYLNDIINFEGFLKYLTHEEQQQLMKYLPSIDTSRSPESLKNMFKSPKFLETTAYFQQLLQEGIFDLSFSGANVEDCRNLRRHVLLNVKKSVWVELYKKMKDKPDRQIMLGKESSTRPSFPGDTKLKSLKRPHKAHNYNSSGIMRSPKRIWKSGPSSLLATLSAEPITDDVGSKLTDETDGFENEGASFSPSSLFASSPDTGSLLAPLQFTADSSDHDVLLDVPHNASFAEAELLCHPWKEKASANASPEESGVVDGEESLSSFPTSFTNIQAKHR